MQRLCPLLLAAALACGAGCATRPPLPPDCEGALVPINPIQPGLSPVMPGTDDGLRPRS